MSEAVTKQVEGIRVIFEDLMIRFKHQAQFAYGFLGRSITPEEMGDVAKREMFLMKEIFDLRAENTGLRGELNCMREYFNKIQEILGIKE